MSKRVVNRSINIDGAKLKELLESATGKTIKELSLANGYSDSFLRMAIKTNKATPNVVTLAKLYGIELSAYEVKPEPEPTTSEPAPEQMTIDDVLAPDTKEALRSFINDAVREALIDILNNFECNEVRAYYDEREQVFNLALKIKREPIGVVRGCDKWTI